jgi:uncharacterized protein
VDESIEERIGAVRSLHEGALLSRDRLFELLDDGVEWWVAGDPAVFPWAGTFRGHDGVRQWSAALNAAMEYRRFELLEIFGTGDRVVEVIAAGGNARATGSPFASEVVRIWTFRGPSATVVRSFYDTHGYAAALVEPGAPERDDDADPRGKPAKGGS